MRKQIFQKSLFLIIGLLSAGLFLLGGSAKATSPTTINFQGKVVNNTTGNVGTNISDTSYSIVFRLYNTASPTIGTTCTAGSGCLWEETDSVSTTNSIFQVELGNNCSFFSGASCNNSTPIDFSTNSLYLTMKFNGDTSGSNNGFMTPLIHFTGIPYAYYSSNSAALNGLASSNFVQMAQGLQADSSNSNASIAINKTGSASIIDIRSSNTTVLALSNGGGLTVSPTGSNTGTIVKQTTGTATSGNIFDIQGANGTSHFIQVAETAANAGSISITSLGSNAVTIDSGSGTVVFGSNTTTLQKSGSTFTLDVSNGASNSTLNISNSGGAGNVTLQLDTGGAFAVGASTGQSLTCGANTAPTGSTFTGGILTTAGTCTSVSGGSATLKNAYDNGSTNGGKILLTSTGGGLVLQNATSDSLSNLFKIENNAETFNYLSLTLSSSVPHLQVFGASSTEYADIYYDATNHKAVFAASGSNSTVIGSGSGPVSITAGASSAVTITGHANSTISTDSGYLRMDAPSGIQLGTPSSSSGNLVFNYGSGSSTAAITFAGNSNANYSYILPSTTVSSNSCLQSGTVSSGSVPLAFGACGTSLSVNGSGVGSTGNLQNTTGTNSVAGNTFTNSSGNITLAIDAATGSVSGIVTATGTQTFGGSKIISGSLQVQSASGLTVGTSSNAGIIALFNGTNSVSIQGAGSTSAYTLVLPGTSGTSNYCLANTSTLGTLQWLACGASSTASISLSPEFAGAVMTADGANNTGTMTSDFCGNDGAGSFPDINTGVCNTSGDFHNYYNWTSTGANDYDIFVRWRVPTDFSSFNAVTFNSKKSATGDDVKLTIYTAAGAVCGTGTSMTNTASAWQTTTYTISGCSPVAGDIITFDVHMAVAASGNTVQMGEIPITYNRK